MDFFRCVLAGVASLVVGVVILAFGGMVALTILSQHWGFAAISVDVTYFARSPIAWTVALALFALGFIGEYRRSV